MMKKYPIVLSIAGSDCSGGAGIQADIKAISATGSYAASAITAVTVQNTQGVTAVHPVPLDILSGQIKAVFEDLSVGAVKIGMLHSSDVVGEVARMLAKFKAGNVVLDPVMVSTSGHRLIKEDAIQSMKDLLLPMASVLTPNIPEAEILCGMTITCREEMEKAARMLSLDGRISVWMKAGHLEEDTLVDVFYYAPKDRFLYLASKKCLTSNTHGTGCTLSSAMASYLAQGYDMEDAAFRAKDYLSRAIISGAQYEIGHGHGPVNHFWNLP